MYFALIKVRGKQIKRSLNTSDAALARRRLAELRTKAHGLVGEKRGMTFDHLAERWLALKKPDLRPGSWRRLDGIVLKSIFPAVPCGSIGQTQIEHLEIETRSDRESMQLRLRTRSVAAPDQYRARRITATF